MQRRWTETGVIRIYFYIQDTPMANKKDESVNARFLDAKDEPNQRLLPIRGYEKGPLLTLRETVQPLAELLDDLDTNGRDGPR